jgi:hypothetical protein
MTWVIWNLVSVHLETVLLSVQDRSTVCAKRTIGPKIILDAPDRCSVYAKRTLGLEIILDEPDGTPW